MTTAHHTRLGLNTRIRRVLDHRAARGDLTWSTYNEGGRLLYRITPGPSWGAFPPPPLVGLTAGDVEAWAEVPAVLNDCPYCGPEWPCAGSARTANGRDVDAFERAHNSTTGRKPGRTAPEVTP